MPWALGHDVTHLAMPWGLGGVKRHYLGMALGVGWQRLPYLSSWRACGWVAGTALTQQAVPGGWVA